MNILIYGSGNTGFAASAYLSNLSKNIMLYTRNNEKSEIINKRGLKSNGIIEKEFKIKVTSNLDKALEFADYIFIFTKANAHKDVFENLKGKLNKNQKIIVFNGNWGAYEGYNILKDELINKNIALGETASMPFIASSQDVGVVKIIKIKSKTKIGFVGNNSQATTRELKDIFTDLDISQNAIETSISATNPVIHVPIALFNIARIENKEKFRFYKDGLSNLSVKYIENIDKERIRIANALNIKCPTVLESINSFWEIKYDNLYDALISNYPDTLAPSSIEHRYFEEDIPYGLLPIIKLGDILDIDVNYTKSMVDLVGYYKNKNYYNQSFNINLEDLHKLKNKI